MSKHTALRSRVRAAAGIFLLAGAATLPSPSRAAWPPPPDMTQAQAAMQSNWPNDPDFGGQFEHWSFVPANIAMNPGFRTPELALGAGHNTDRAWGLSAGDPRVLIAVLDSGIKWDNADLILNEALNIGELPRPQQADGSVASGYDANGDGLINVADYLNDARITCGATTLPHNLRGCRDGGGTANDPNRNGILDAGDLIRVFSDGVDDDHNGYVDDIAGWDFFMDDNDPYDDTRFGHGTGEANWSNAPGNDGRGSIGGCPRCQFVLLRAGDSFITDVNDFAQAVLYAADADYGQGRRVRVVQEALGTVNNSALAMAAIDYAYGRGLTVVASAADENSRHHNVPGTNNHTLYVHAIQYDSGGINAAKSFLAFNNCTNYGGQLMLSTSGTGCSSEATGQTSGLSGLLYSYALQRNLDPPLRGAEVMQLLARTADDISIPESIPGAAGYNPLLYPSRPGWDQRFAYGRPNVRRAMEWMRDGKLPPEVDITSPRWFTVLYRGATAPHVFIEGTIDASRTAAAPGGPQDFDYVVEWAPGIEPADNAWTAIPSASGNHVTAPMRNTRLADIDVNALPPINNPGEVENRYTITVRIRVVAHYGGTVGDVPGELRRVFSVINDPDLRPGFPIDMHASGESSPHAADLDGNGQQEVVIVSSDGVVHAYTANGTELAGFPVHTNPDFGFGNTDDVNYTDAPAYTAPTGGVAPIPQELLYETVLASPGIADLDGDGDLEIVVNGYHGTVYVWNHDGTPYGHGFPRRLPQVCSAEAPTSRVPPGRACSAYADETHVLQRGIFGSPVLVDLDVPADNKLEIVFGAFDGYLYALRANDASDQPGFPVQIHFPGRPNQEFNRVFGNVGVGNMNGDGIPDLVVGSNERISNSSGERNTNSGALYLVHGDGMRHAGGPYHASFPIALTSIDFFPLVGEGLSVSPAIADVDGNGKDDLVIIGNGLPSMVVAKGEQSGLPPNPEPLDLSRHSVLSANRGPLSNLANGQLSFAPVFSIGSFGDMDGDGRPEYVHAGASINLAIAISGVGNRPFAHMLGAWNPRTGATLDGFPQVIEDYTFFMNPAIGDVSGDGYPEILVGTGGYYLRAVDACGREAAGWPKFTGQWIIPNPLFSDMDGDQKLDIVTGTRSGFLYAWKTNAATTGNVQWPTHRHDNRNTGNYGSRLEIGSNAARPQPLVCPAPPAPDAGVPDAAAGGDAATEAGTGLGQRHIGGGSCLCSAPGRTGQGGGTGTAGVVLALLGLAVTASRRRRAAA